VVDYDTQTHVMRFFNVSERSTFIAFNGEAEVTRISGVTDLEAIQRFLLAAAN
jgi:hypothetical protein